MNIAFYFHASVAVIAMGLAMFAKMTTHALLFAVLSLLSLAVSLYTMSAELAAALEVLVYSGAIMVLFVFAIMLIRPKNEEETIIKKSYVAMIILLIAGFVGELFIALPTNLPVATASEPFSLNDIARALFNQYGLFVEVISFVLLGGLVTALFIIRGFSGSVSKRSVEQITTNERGAQS